MHGAGRCLADLRGSDGGTPVACGGDGTDNTITGRTTWVMN